MHLVVAHGCPDGSRPEKSRYSRVTCHVVVDARIAECVGHTPDGVLCRDDNSIESPRSGGGGDLTRRECGRFDVGIAERSTDSTPAAER